MQTDMQLCVRRATTMSQAQSKAEILTIAQIFVMPLWTDPVAIVDRQMTGWMLVARHA